MTVSEKDAGSFQWEEEVELTSSNVYSEDLVSGYHIDAVRCLASAGIITGVKYNLLKDGDVVHTFSAEQAASQEKQPEEIMRSLKPYLVTAEGEEAASWIEQTYLKKPECVPPWVRTQPVRKTDLEPLSAVTAEVSIKAKIDEFTLNDSGNAQRFVAECRGWLVYDKSSSEWFAWVDNHWEPAVEKLSMSERFVAASLKNELAYIKSLQIRFADNGAVQSLLKSYVYELARHIDTSLNASRLSAMSKLAQADLSVDLQKESNLHLLAFKNGAVDTSSGQIYQMWECSVLKEQYPVVYVDRMYKPGCKAKRFEEHLRILFTDNTSENLPLKEQIDREIDTNIYFRRYLGYLLTAGNREQIIVFWYGSGSNGKSTTINLLRHVLEGQVAEASCKELYTSRDEKPASGISQGLSARVLLFSEMGSDEDNIRCTKYNKESVKVLTGDTATSAYRDLYKPSETKAIICKPIALTNSFPAFNSVDEGLQRRIVTIPFPHKFADKERDKSMEAKLYAEADEIFTLMVDELIRYCNEGLPPLPDYCQKIRNQLLSGGIYSEFALSEFCLSKDKGEANKTKGSSLQEMFLRWCDKKAIDVKTKVTKKFDEREDASGQKKFDTMISVINLADGEVRKLYNAFRVEYGSVNIHGVEYFNCKPVSR